jgi:Na+/melibiose symporter-like transporter
MKPQDADLKVENFAIDTSISLPGDNPLTNIKSKKQLWIIIGIVALNSIGKSIVLPLLPFIVGKYLPSAQVVVGMSALLSVFAACAFFAAPTLGALSGEYGGSDHLIPKYQIGDSVTH